MTDATQPLPIFTVAYTEAPFNMSERAYRDQSELANTDNVKTVRIPTVKE